MTVRPTDSVRLKTVETLQTPHAVIDCRAAQIRKQKLNAKFWFSLKKKKKSPADFVYKAVSVKGSGGTSTDLITEAQL